MGTYNEPILNQDNKKPNTAFIPWRWQITPLPLARMHCPSKGRILLNYALATLITTSVGSIIGNLAGISEKYENTARQTTAAELMMQGIGTYYLGRTINFEIDKNINAS